MGMSALDEEKFDEISWELQLLAAKVSKFMEERRLDCLNMTVQNGWTLTLQSNRKVRTPQNDHGMDERKAAHGT